MFAVFSRDTALPPTGLLSPLALLDDEEETEPAADGELEDVTARKTRRSFELKRHCAETLASVRERHSHAHARGDGGSGFAFSAGPRCHWAEQQHVSCLFVGGVSQWPGLDLLAESRGADVCGLPEDGHDMAAWLLAFYATFRGLALRGIAEEALRSLAGIEGAFAFVIHDAKSHRVLAARDRAGRQPLFWGETPDGRLLLSSELSDLAECDPTATAFPAGSLFLSEERARAAQPGPLGWTIDRRLAPGELLSFVPRAVPAPAAPFRGVKAVPRVTSQGCLCGAVYRVASEGNVADWGSSR